MNKLQIVISFFVLFSISICSPLVAQTDTTIIIEEKGNLELLTERIYLAFKAYNTGVNRFYPDRKKDKTKQIQLDSLRKHGWIIDMAQNEEKLFYVRVIRKGEQRFMRGSELNKIPADSIKTIEIVHPDMTTIALYGVVGGNSCIVIRLKQ